MQNKRIRWSYVVCVVIALVTMYVIRFAHNATTTPETPPTPPTLPTLPAPSASSPVLTSPAIPTTPTAQLRRSLFPAPQSTLDDLRQRLTASDARILGWNPEGGYDVLLTPATLATFTATGIRAEASPLPMTPKLRRALTQSPTVDVAMVFATPVHARALATQYGGQRVGDTVRLTLPSAEVSRLIATSPELLASDLVYEARLYTHASRSDRFLSADTLQLENTWLRGEGEIVGVLDSGCSFGASGWANAHRGLKTRMIRLCGQPWGEVIKDGSDPSGHGTHVAGCIAGTGDFSTNKRFRGVAPGARLFFQGAALKATDFFVPETMDTVYDEVYRAGGRIHSNSWGDNPQTDSAGYAEPPDYGLIAWANDRYVWEHQDFLPLFASGNEGADLDFDGIADLRTLYSRTTTAKNSLVVGAAESYQVEGKTSDGVASVTYSAYPIFDGKISDRLSDDPIAAAPGEQDVRGLAIFSCTGPLADGRIKPDIVAPGTQIVSALRTGLAGLKTTLTTANGASASERQYYTTLSGTSMSTPLTAGACAIIRQYCREVLGIERPTSPVVRALLIGGANSMYPGQFGDGPDREFYSADPNGREGFGLISLQRSLTPESGRPTVLSFTATAETALTYTVTVTEAAPFRATLVWNDYPAPVYATQALVNDLDLTLTNATGEVVAYANGLTAPDRINVVERIDATLAPGTYTLSVTVHRMPFPGGEAALVIHTPEATPTPYLAYTPLTHLKPETETPLHAKLLWPETASDTLTLELLTDGEWAPQASLTLPARPAGENVDYRFVDAAGNVMGTYRVPVATTVKLTVATESEAWILATPSLHDTIDVIPGQRVTCTAQDTEVFTYNGSVGNALYRITGWTLSDGTTTYASGNTATATFDVPTDTGALTLTWTTGDAETAPPYGFVHITLDGEDHVLRHGDTFTFPHAYAGHGYWQATSTGPQYKGGDQLLNVTKDATFHSALPDVLTTTDTDGDGYRDNEELLDKTDPFDPTSVPTPPRLQIHEDPPVRTPVPDKTARHIAFTASDNAEVTRIEILSRKKGATTWTHTAIFDKPAQATVTPLAAETEYCIRIADPLGWNTYTHTYSTTRPTHTITSPIYTLRLTPGYLLRLR